MLDLNDERWTLLADAYGPAWNIPQLLRRVEADPSPNAATESEPWHSLWSRLCHQDDVFAASFAAVPHLIRIGLVAQGPIAWDILALPVSIEIARVRRGTLIPDALNSAYLEALDQLPRVVCANT